MGKLFESWLYYCAFSIAGYWAFLYERQDLVPSESFKEFFETKEWETQICELLAFHLEEVDLSNFI